MANEHEAKVTIKRLGRGKHLHRIIPILDSSGKVIDRVVKPLMVEVRARDLMQILVGSAILAIPAAYTEETWNLGEQLPMPNILILGIVSILFIALFVYYNFYRHFFKNYVFDYFKRVISIYLISMIVVGLLLTLIQKCPWDTDIMLAIKRIIVVSFPASMSAAVSDILK